MAAVQQDGEGLVMRHRGKPRSFGVSLNCSAARAGKQRREAYQYLPAKLTAL